MKEILEKILAPTLKHIEAVGAYFVMLYDVFRKPTKAKVMRKLIMRDIDDLIYNSIGIVAFISIFVGAVVSIQMALNLGSPFIPKSLIGFATRQTIVLEFAPTLTSIIIAGKVGSFITSSIGTMRVTEQIDALDVMGVNSLNYLVFPKIISMLLYPFLISFSMFVGIVGGYFATMWGNYSTGAEFVEGLRLDFRMFDLLYAFFKTLIFSFLLATIPSYHGYFMKGGALDVGKASTVSFVWSCIAIMVVDLLITQLMLGQ